MKISSFVFAAALFLWSLSSAFSATFEKTCSNCYTTRCNRQTGECEQCQPGFFGRYCDITCHDKCHMTGNQRYCSRDDGRCLDGCVSGWHGPHCKTRCNENCKFSECHSDDGFCTYPCEVGHYGSHCNSKCNDHCKFGCNRHNGACIDGCKNHFYGENCSECNQITGQCLMCKEGLCGEECTSKCSENCERNICHMNGTCKHGCQENKYHGHRCQEKCADGCITCNQLTGNCIEYINKYDVVNSKRRLNPSVSVTQSSSENSGTYHLITQSFTYHMILGISLTSHFTVYMLRQ